MTLPGSLEIQRNVGLCPFFALEQVELSVVAFNDLLAQSADFQPKRTVFLRVDFELSKKENSMFTNAPNHAPNGLVGFA